MTDSSVVGEVSVDTVLKLVTFSIQADHRLFVFSVKKETEEEEWSTEAEERRDRREVSVVSKEKLESDKFKSVEAKQSGGRMREEGQFNKVCVRY